MNNSNLKLEDIKIGDRVIYISGYFGESRNNPLWGGTEGYIIGTVKEVPKGRDSFVYVDWDNNGYNSYRPEDLDFASVGYAEEETEEINKWATQELLRLGETTTFKKGDPIQYTGENK